MNRVRVRAWLRNPMYVAVLAIILGQALLFGSWGCLIYACVVFAAVFPFVKTYEEPTLTEAYREEYLEHKRHVRGWIPRMTPWSASR